MVVVAEEAEETPKEATQEAIQSSSKALVEELGDKEVAGEAIPDRPHAVHGEDRGQGRPADTGNSNCTQYVTIEATKPVMAEYNFVTTKHIVSHSFQKPVNLMKS